MSLASNSHTITVKEPPKQPLYLVAYAYNFDTELKNEIYNNFANPKLKNLLLKEMQERIKPGENTIFVPLKKV